MKAAATSTVALIVAFLVAEAGLRHFSPIYTVGIQSSYQYDPELGVVLRKSVNLSRLTDHREEIRTNRFGVADFRESYAGYPKLAFAIGDSYTQGTGLPADESYPMQLDQMLNRDGAGMFLKRIAVVNVGLGSYGGEQSLLALKRFEKTLGAPAYCLYLGSDNDFDDDLLFKSGSRHRQLVVGSPKWGRFARPLAWIGGFQTILRAKLLLADRRLNALRRAAFQTRGADTSVAAKEWPIVEQIVSECRAKPAVPILSWVVGANSDSYAWLRSKSAANGIAFNDWYPRFTSVAREIPQLPEYNPHSGRHYRGWVASIIADGFRRQMRDAQVF
ncbi:MAG: hypothetical protein ABJC63_00045 [Gemmatimonadales bacterium]